MTQLNSDVDVQLAEVSGQPGSGPEDVVEDEADAGAIKDHGDGVPASVGDRGDSGRRGQRGAASPQVDADHHATSGRHLDVQEVDGADSGEQRTRMTGEEVQVQTKPTVGVVQREMN